MRAAYQSTNVLCLFTFYHQKPAEPRSQELERLALMLLDSDSRAKQLPELRGRVEIDVDRCEAISEVQLNIRAIP
jgi:hypothetical protein